MISIRFDYAGPSASIATRALLGRPIPAFAADALSRFPPIASPEWRVTLGPDLLFDEDGLRLVAEALAEAPAAAARVTFTLVPDERARREYFSLQPGGGARVPLPIVAERSVAGGEHALDLELPAREFDIPFPASMFGPQRVSMPTALLFAAKSPFDLLFANQIALTAEIARRARTSPRAFIKGLARPGLAPTFPQRIALSLARVHPDAQVHRTAVLEGAIIEAGARVGAHCVVRYSHVGPGARLHDGAKVELSVVGKNAWLMHDLVLYRSATEDDVFLIHGPYQFSLFHRASAAFATILMDYRPDGKPIQVETPEGLRPYEGFFLGAVYGEASKTMGGSSIAPGRVIPPGVWLGQDPGAIHLLRAKDLATGKVLPPSET